MGQKLGGKGHIGTNLMTQDLLEYQTSGLKAWRKRALQVINVRRVHIHGYQPHDTSSITYLVMYLVPS